MKVFRLFLVAILAAGGIISAQDGRIFNPRSADMLEAESRDEWQKPDRVVEALQIPSGAAVVDVGTGSGYFVPYLSRAAGPQGKVYAVDIQQEMLAMVERKIDELQLTNVTTVLSQESDTRLNPSSVDLVLLVDVYHELGSPRALLSNFGKILKPDGRLVIIDFFSDKEVPGIGPPLRHRVPERRLVAEVQAAGFEVVKQHSFLSYQYFLVFALAEPSGDKNQGP